MTDWTNVIASWIRSSLALLRKYQFKNFETKWQITNGFAAKPYITSVSFLYTASVACWPCSTLCILLSFTLPTSGCSFSLQTVILSWEMHRWSNIRLSIVPMAWSNWLGIVVHKSCPAVVHAVFSGVKKPLRKQNSWSQMRWKRKRNCKSRCISTKKPVRIIVLSLRFDYAYANNLEVPQIRPRDLVSLEEQIGERMAMFCHLVCHAIDGRLSSVAFG